MPLFDEVRVAVAPALNHSGSAEFDPAKVGDLMASELSGLEGVKVVGVSRVLAVLAEQGDVRIRSPEHALEVCERLGVDLILVFAVTEYDAYTPVVGLAAQLYGPWKAEGPQGGHFCSSATSSAKTALASSAALLALNDPLIRSAIRIAPTQVATQTA